MLSVDSIENGVVLDHITSTKSMEIYELLHLAELECGICILKNVKSIKMEKKDVIKIEKNLDKESLEVLGFIDPGITVNVIENGKRVQKTKLNLPKRIKNVVKCKNPRCVTTTEPDIAHEFKLTDTKGKKNIYRCVYCEQELAH